VRLSFPFSKKETTALALSAEMVMLIKPPNNPVRETTAGSPATHYQVGKHSSLKEKIRFDRRALFVSFLLQISNAS
jgi:hypothetical protein